MKTTMTPPIITEKHVIDADGVALGRIATRAADLLRGKHKPSFVSHLDIGDSVTIVNSSKVKLTGNKLDQKTYYHHTGYLGHLKEEKLKDLMIKRPEEVVRRAIAGMLPKNRLKAAWLKRLVVIAGNEGDTHADK